MGLGKSRKLFVSVFVVMLVCENVRIFVLSFVCFYIIMWFFIHRCHVVTLLSIFETNFDDCNLKTTKLSIAFCIDYIKALNNGIIS